MGHNDKEFLSPCGYSQKGSEWKVKYTHFAHQTIYYSIYVFNYSNGLTAYEAWHKCNGYWPDSLTGTGVCPAFCECTFDQLNPFPYPGDKRNKKDEIKALIPVLETKHDTLVSNGHNPEA